MEVLGVVVAARLLGVGGGEVPAAIGLPLVEAPAPERFLELLEELGLPDDHSVHARHVPGGEEILPMDGRREPSDPFDSHRVVVRFGIPQRCELARSPREIRLDCHHGRGLGLRPGRVVAEQLEHASHVRHVLAADLLRALVRVEVVVAARQPQATLVKMEHVPIAVLLILEDVHAEHRTRADVVQVGDLGEQVLQVPGTMSRAGSPA